MGKRAESNVRSRRSLLKGGVATVVMMLFGRPLEAADDGLPREPWANWDYGDDLPMRGGYLRLAATQYIGKMNPNHWPVQDWVSMGYFHEKLMVTDGSYNPTMPWLAQSYSYETPTTVIMRLREGVTFHDGSKLNAASVKYQIDWIRNPANGAWSASWLEPLDAVEVVDEYTLRWNFKKPWAGFAGVIANVPGYMLSSKALQELGEQYDSHPQGTGAYLLEEASPGNFLKLKRNPNWWFAKASGHPDMPYFDGIVVTVIPDPSVQLANLRAGKLDVLGLDKSQYAIVKDDPGLNVYRSPLNHVRALRFNNTKSVFQDMHLRQAVSFAINRKALITGTQFGLGRIASCLYPEDHWAHNPELMPVAYDPARAKQLLAEAGYANGLSVRGYFTSSTAGQTVADAIKNMLAKVGIDWQVEPLAPAAVAARMKALDYDLAEGGWTFIYDPDLAATGLYHPSGGFNFGRSKNDAVIALIEAGRSEVDPKKRQQIYWQLEKALYDSYEDVWLWWEESVTAYHKKVRGWNQEQFLKYKEAWFWSHPLWFKDGKA